MDLSVNQLRQVILSAFNLKGSIEPKVSEKILDELLANHANFSYVSRAKEGTFPYTDAVAKALVQGIAQTFDTVVHHAPQ
jgi:hypothetical protein